MPLNFIRHKAKTVFSLRGLLFKSCVFGLSWLLLPFWVFFFVAVYLYAIPFFQTSSLLAPFILTIVVSAIIPYGFLYAFFLGLLFFLLLGIKNLILVNRFESHQLMVSLLLFLIFFSMFSGFDNWQRWTVTVALFGAGLSFFFLFKELADYVVEHSKQKKILIAGIGSFLLWQFASILVFLPLNHFYQTALLFLSSVIMTDVFLEYLAGKLDRRKILNDFSIFFVLVVVILASANWGL